MALPHISFIGHGLFNTILEQKRGITDLDEHNIVSRFLIRRIISVTMGILALCATPVALIPLELYNITRIRSDWHGSWRTVLKIELLNLTAGTIALSQLLLNMICPELLFTESFHLLSLVPKVTALIEKYRYDVDIASITELAHIDVSFLPDRGARLHNYKDEIYELLKRNIVFQDRPLVFQDSPEKIVRTLLERHYDRETLEFAHKDNEPVDALPENEWLNAPYHTVDYMNRLNYDSGLRNRNLERQIQGHTVFEVLLKRKGEAFAKRVLAAYFVIQQPNFDKTVRAARFVHFWDCVANSKLCTKALYDCFSTYGCYTNDGNTDFLETCLFDNDIDLAKLSRFSNMYDVADALATGFRQTKNPHLRCTNGEEASQRWQTRILQFVSQVQATNVLSETIKRKIFTILGKDNFALFDIPLFLTNFLKAQGDSKEHLKTLYYRFVAQNKPQEALQVLQHLQTTCPEERVTCETYLTFQRTLCTHAVQLKNEALVMQVLNTMNPEYIHVHMGPGAFSDFYTSLPFDLFEVAVANNWKEATSCLLRYGIYPFIRDYSSSVDTSEKVRSLVQQTREKFGEKFVVDAIKQGVAQLQNQNQQFNAVATIINLNEAPFISALFEISSSLSNDTKIVLLTYAVRNQQNDKIEQLKNIIDFSLISTRAINPSSYLFECLVQTSSIELLFFLFKKLNNDRDIDTANRFIIKGLAHDAFANNFIALWPADLSADQLITFFLYAEQSQKALSLIQKWVQGEKNPVEASKIFCNAVETNCKEAALLVLDYIDIHFRDKSYATPLIKCAKHCSAGVFPNNRAPLLKEYFTTWGPIVYKLIERGARLTAKDYRNESAYSLLKTRTEGTSFVSECLQHVPLENEETKNLLCFLLEEESSFDDAYSLYTRITQNSPVWFTKKCKELFFFKIANSRSIGWQRRELLCTLVSEIDSSATDPANKKKSALMIACELGLNEKVITTLLQNGASICYCDTDGCSALQYIGKQELLLAPKIAHPFLVKLGINSQTLQELSSWDKLIAYLKGDIHEDAHAPLIARLGSLLLLGDISRLKRAFSAMEFSKKLTSVEQLIDLFGAAARPTLFNTILTISPAHYAIETTPHAIPQKQADQFIDDMMAFYIAYAEHQSDDDKALLASFIKKVTDKQAYIGTPQANSAALTEFYTIIDNATCNAITHFRDTITNITEKSNGKTVLQLAQENNTEAKDLVSSIRNWLREYIEAAPYCGGRIYTNAIQQYSRICLNKQDTIRPFIATSLAMMREYIASSLFENQDQSVHAYTSFIRLFGADLGISTTSGLEQFEDIFAHSREEAEAAKNRFFKHYTPAAMIDMIHNVFQGDTVHRDLFISYVKQLPSTNSIFSRWNDQACAKVEEAVTTIWNIPELSLAEKKERTSSFLQNAPYYMTLDGNDLQSLATIAAEIKSQASDGRLFIAKCMKQQSGGTTFADNAILAALVDMGILV